VAAEEKLSQDGLGRESVEGGNIGHGRFSTDEPGTESPIITFARDCLTM
jgi:hypothetical protein